VASKPALNFKQQHELNTLPDRIAALEKDVAALQAILDDPLLYTKEPERFDKTLRLLAAKQAEAEAAMNRWAELETLASAG
jgi:ATP-binding cassette subfamily F protein uup